VRLCSVCQTAKYNMSLQVERQRQIFAISRCAFKTRSNCSSGRREHILIRGRSFANTRTCQLTARDVVRWEMQLGKACTRVRLSETVVTEDFDEGLPLVWHH
jgi:hypothetical protein